MSVGHWTGPRWPSLEHKLIPNSDSGNMISSVGLNSLFDELPLPCVGFAVRRKHIVSKKNFNVHLGLLDGFKLVDGW